MKRQCPVARHHAAPPLPAFTITCARCQVDHVSTEPALPDGWMIVTAGVRCPDCAPAARKAARHG